MQFGNPNLPSNPYAMPTYAPSQNRQKLGGPQGAVAPQYPTPYGYQNSAPSVSGPPTAAPANPTKPPHTNYGAGGAAQNGTTSYGNPTQGGGVAKGGGFGGYNFGGGAHYPHAPGGGPLVTAPGAPAAPTYVSDYHTPGPGGTINGVPVAFSGPPQSPGMNWQGLMGQMGQGAGWMNGPWQRRSYGFGGFGQ